MPAPWLASARFDLGLLLGPPLTAVLLVAVLPSGLTLSPLAWLALVVCIDVAHVYASLCLPQVTHYVLDGFIWRLGPSNPELRSLLEEA